MGIYYFTIDMVGILNSTLPILYFLVLIAYGISFFTNVSITKHVKRVLLIFLTCIHCCFLILVAFEYGYLPLTTVIHVFSFLALSLLLLYLFIEIFTHNSDTGVFILAIAFFFQLIASIWFSIDTMPEILRSHYFGVHVIAGLLAYASLTIAGLYGFLYLLMYREMKQKRFTVFFRKLPPLELLENMTFVALTSTFVFSSITISVGSFWLITDLGSSFFGDAKIISTLLLWIFYAVLLLLYKSKSLQQTVFMKLIIFVCCLTLIMMVLINSTLTEFHAFF